jgi:hypothetical protein
MDFEYILYWGGFSKLSDELNFYLYLSIRSIFHTSSAVQMGSVCFWNTTSSYVKWKSPKGALSVNIHTILFLTQLGYDEVHFETRFLDKMPFGSFVLVFSNNRRVPRGKENCTWSICQMFLSIQLFAVFPQALKIFGYMQQVIVVWTQTVKDLQRVDWLFQRFM